MELDLRIAVSGSLGDSKGIRLAEIEQSTERAMVLCQRPGINWERAWWALYSMFWIRHLRPETHKACEIAEELVEQAEQHGEASASGGGRTLVGVGKDVRGRLRDRGSTLRSRMGFAGID